MKFSYNWLRELAPGLEIDPTSLMRQITMKTAECEGVEEVGPLLASASLARIDSVELIEGSHNRIAIVDTERYGRKTVICGAPNCLPGHTTVYVPIGKKIIQGVESDGMLASASELGLNKDHSGILDLPEGQPLSLTPDHIIEVDNKSLTHRPDLWGHLGMAREVAAITHGSLRDPVDLSRLRSGPSEIEVEIQDFTLCPRFTALVFENATIQPSPLWLQYRLYAIGLNPINNIVDVSNYIMAELAQPTHAYDADRLPGKRIVVRPAREGEIIVALNKEVYQLSAADLVIADAEEAIGIAGVIGGLASSIDDQTTRIVFEAANFQAAGVRKTSSRLKIRTDASMRFEKGQDPLNTVRAQARAIELLEEVSPGIRLVGGLVDVKTELRKPAPIAVPIDWLSAKLGKTATAREVRELLEALEFGVSEETPGILSVTVPSWRATKDVSVKDDVLEEVGRIIGYDSITPRPPMAAAAPPPQNPLRLYFRRVRSMAAAQGFTEVSNYSFLSEDAARAFGLDPEQHVRVANPIASDQSLMRLSLLPGIYRNIQDNSRHFSSFRLFEIGREIHKRDAGLPDEIPHFMAAVYAKDGDGAAGLFELKRLAECLVQSVTRGSRADQGVGPTAALAYEHPERSAEIAWRGEAVGRLFELHPSLGLDGRAAVLDVDLAHMHRLDTVEKKYQPLRRFPTSAFDLSVIVPLRETVGSIRGHLEPEAGPDVVSVEFVRQYTGAPLPEDRKSVSFRVTVGSAERTLSSDEAGTIRNRLIERLRGAGYELRL
jgi:phenylalanyl-tRNA synthetase beta chain